MIKAAKDAFVAFVFAILAFNEETDHRLAETPQLQRSALRPIRPISEYGPRVVKLASFRARFDLIGSDLRSKSLNQKAACVCEKMVIFEYRSGAYSRYVSTGMEKNRHLQPHRATFGTGSKASF
ncbi:hypothetical protein HED55_24210 [Ochrobactrum haematophilum]|uniref:Uncharacterized protein n=1 Tax=Brucella haematophila TaxID=419474 RepID=A0ABX1DWL0_9HYPH|nr:hypothetical protein [Brucella haematophila]